MDPKQQGTSKPSGANDSKGDRMDAEDAIAALESNPKGIRFSKLASILNEHFGRPRQKGTSHRIYHTPWPGNPRLNIQNRKGMAKAYQVRQAIAALRKKMEQGANRPNAGTTPPKRDQGGGTGANHEYTGRATNGGRPQERREK